MGYPSETAESIAAQMRSMCWWRRDVRFDWLARCRPQMAEKVAALMAPDELLCGTLTGKKATGDVIALPDHARPPLRRQLSIEDAFERSVRSRN